MNSEHSMREIDAMVRDFVLHIQKLESEKKELQKTIYSLSYKLARVTEEAQDLDFRCARLHRRVEDAAKQIKSVCLEDDDLPDRTVKRLWKALDILGE